MIKRIFSCLLVLMLITAFLPASAATQINGVSIRDIEMSAIAGSLPYIRVAFKSRESEPAMVQVAIVPAGTTPATGTSLEMLGSGETWYYFFDSVNTILDIGDFNLWFFIDNNPEPITDNKCWRVYDGYVSYYETFKGLDPIRAYAQVTNWTTTDFTLNIYSVSGDTKLELVKKIDGNVILLENITTAGIKKYSFPTGLTGTYILRYTRGDRSQDIGYISLLGGELPFAILGYDTKAKLEPSSCNGIIGGWSKGENSSTGTLKAEVFIAYEDFDYATELYLVNKDTSTETLLARSFESGALGANVTVEKDDKGRWIFGGAYTFEITINTKPAAGTYSLRVKRGAESFDIWQFEMFNDVLYGMEPGETPIKPSSVDDPALLNEYYRIFILGETIEATGTSYYSIDGGKKWQPINSMAEYNKRNPKTGQLNSSKIFDKGFELWFSDTAPSGKNMPDSAKLTKFPKVGKRPKSAKLAVDYQLAHLGSDGVLSFDFYDENLWVPVKKGTTEMLSEGYLYRYGGVKETNKGDLKQTGKPDWADRYYILDSKGIPIPESDEENGGIRYSETSDRVSYKTIKENYFVSTIPYLEGGVYYPASKPAKLAVSSYLKPKAMKIDYKKETMKLVAGAVFEDKRIYNGIVPATTAKSKTDGVISVTEMLDNDWLNGSYQIVPTSKKPASCPVFWEFAYRGDMMELDKEGDRAKEINITEYGKFTPSKALEFRESGGKWGSFKAPKSGGASYEYRTKCTAKGGKLMFDSEWLMIDSMVFKKEYEDFVWAAGKTQTFEYKWGVNYKAKNGKTPTKDGVEWTNIG